MRYHLSGFVVDSDLPLSGNVVSVCGPADLTIAVCADLGNSDQGFCVLDTQLGDAFDNLRYQVLRLTTGVLVRLVGVVDFLIDDTTIRYRLTGSDGVACVSQHVQVSALSLWFEMRGLPVLHGSAVGTGTGAVAFLGDCGAGKSVMASALHCAGLALLTDDAVVISEECETFSIRPAPAHVRVWPDAADRFWGGVDRWPQPDERYAKRRVTVPAKSVACASEPLLLVCLLDRDASCSEPELVTVPGADALQALVGHTYGPRTVSALGLTARRLPVLARFASKVPVVRLRYPDGFDQLSTVVPVITDALLSRATAMAS